MVNVKVLNFDNSDSSYDDSYSNDDKLFCTMMIITRLDVGSLIENNPPKNGNWPQIKTFSFSKIFISILITG